MRRLTVAVALLVAVQVGLAPAQAHSSAPAAASAVPAATAVVDLDDDHVTKVLAVSIDGLNPEAIRLLGPEGAPNLHRLIDEGASTLNARTAVESTSTLPNHTGMLTSRRVDALRGGHGVSFNDDTARTTVHRAAGHYVPSVFDVAHDRGRRTALYTSKDKFAIYNRSWNRRHGARDTVGRDNGRDKIDRFTYREDEKVLLELLLDDLSDGAAAFTFLHLSRTDKVGHERGYMSDAYLEQVKAEDARLGRLLALIGTTRKLRRHLVVLLTSDHGGLGTSHSAADSPVNYTVPLMVWGRGVGGADLYALNTGYADPVTTRPDYDVDPQPIRNAVLANLTTDLLDLPALSGSQVNDRHDLQVAGD